MKSRKEIEAMGKCIVEQYVALPDRSFFGNDNRGEEAHLAGLVQRMLDDKWGDGRVNRELESEFALADEEGPHADWHLNATWFLEWVLHGDDNYETDSGYTPPEEG